MVIAAIRALCGGPNLSRVNGLERLCASETLKTLKDINGNWSKLADVDVNATEQHRLQRQIQQKPAKESLEHLHFWRLTETFFLKKIVDEGGASVRANLRRLVACVLVTLCLSRPTTRSLLCLALALALALARSLSRALSLSLCFSLSLSVSVSLSVSLSLCVCVFVFHYWFSRCVYVVACVQAGCFCGDTSRHFGSTKIKLPSPDFIF